MVLGWQGEAGIGARGSRRGPGKWGICPVGKEVERGGPGGRSGARASEGNNFRQMVILKE